MSKDGNIPSNQIFRTAQVKKVYNSQIQVLGPDAALKKQLQSSRSSFKQLYQSQR